MSNEWGPDFSRLTVLIIEEACQRSIELCDKEISEITLILALCNNCINLSLIALFFHFKSSELTLIFYTLH